MNKTETAVVARLLVQIDVLKEKLYRVRSSEALWRANYHEKNNKGHRVTFVQPFTCDSCLFRANAEREP